MPADRSNVRQGSHHPIPYVRHNAGPSNPDTVAAVVQSDRTRRRQTMPGNTDRTRSNQATKRPVSDVIDISSDEDEPSTLGPTLHIISDRIKELEKDNERLKAALEAAVPAHASPPTLGPEESPPAQVPAEQLERLLTAIGEQTGCEVCTLKLWYPYTLACGHTFCASCIQEWFNVAYIDHMAKHPYYSPQQLIPLNLRAQLLRANLPPRQRRNATREVARVVGTIVHPHYTCPKCRMLIDRKPVENFVAKNVVEAVASVEGQSAPDETPRPSQDPFDGYFPFAKFM